MKRVHYTWIAVMVAFELILTIDKQRNRADWQCKLEAAACIQSEGQREHTVANN